MKPYKKIFALLLSLIMCVSVALFAACRDGENPPNSGTSSESPSSGEQSQAPNRAEIVDVTAIITQNATDLTVGDVKKVADGEADLADKLFGDVTVGELLWVMVNADEEFDLADGSGGVGLTASKFALYDDGNWYIENLSPDGQVTSTVKFNAFTTAVFNYKLKSVFDESVKLDLGSQVLRIDGDRKAVDLLFENFYPQFSAVGGVTLSGSAIIKQIFAANLGVSNTVVDWLCDLTVKQVYAFSGGDYSACGTVTVEQVCSTLELLFKSDGDDAVGLPEIVLGEISALLGGETEIKNLSAALPQINLHAAADSFAKIAKAAGGDELSAEVFSALCKLSFSEQATLSNAAFIGADKKVAEYISAVKAAVEKVSPADEKTIAYLEKFAAVFGDSTLKAPALNGEKLQALVREIIGEIAAGSSVQIADEQLTAIVNDVVDVVNKIISEYSKTVDGLNEKIAEYADKISLNFEKLQTQVESLGALDFVLAFAGSDSNGLSVWLFGEGNEANLIKDLSAVTVGDLLGGGAQAKINSIDATHCVEFVRAVANKSQELKSSELVVAIKKVIAHFKNLTAQPVTGGECETDLQKLGAALDKANAILAKGNGVNYTVGEIPEAVSSATVSDLYELAYLVALADESGKNFAADEVKFSDILARYKEDVLSVFGGTLGALTIDYDNLAAVITKYAVAEMIRGAEQNGTPLTQEEIAEITSAYKQSVASVINLVVNYAGKGSPEAAESVAAYLEANGTGGLLDCFLALFNVDSAELSAAIFGDKQTTLITELAKITVADLFNGQIAAKVGEIEVNLFIEAFEILYENAVNGGQTQAGASDFAQTGSGVAADKTDAVGAFCGKIKTAFTGVKLSQIQTAINAISVSDAYDLFVAWVRIYSGEAADAVLAEKTEFLAVVGGTLGNITLTADKAKLKTYVKKLSSVVFGGVIGEVMPELSEAEANAACENYSEFFASFVIYVYGDTAALNAYYQKYGASVTMGKLDEEFGGLLAALDGYFGGALAEVLKQQLQNAAYAVKAFYDMPDNMKQQLIQSVIDGVKAEILQTGVGEAVATLCGILGFDEVEANAASDLLSLLFKGNLGGTEFNYEAKISEIIKKIAALYNAFAQPEAGGGQGGDAGEIIPLAA